MSSTRDVQPYVDGLALALGVPVEEMLKRVLQPSLREPMAEPLVLDLLAEYLNSDDFADLAETSQKEYAATLGSLRSRLLAEAPDATPGTLQYSLLASVCRTPLGPVRSYAFRKNRMQGDKVTVANATYNKRIGVLRSFLVVWLRRKGLPQSRAALALRNQPIYPLSRALNDEEVEVLWAEIERPRNRKRNVAIFATFLGAGLRMHELQALTVGCIRFDSAELYVPEYKGKGHQTTVQVAYPTEWCLTALNDHLRATYGTRPWNPELPLWPAEGRKTPMSLSAIRMLVDRKLRAAGIKVPGQGAHCLRHTYAHYIYVLSGGDVRLVQLGLRHKNVATTSRYLIPHLAELRRIVSRLSKTWELQDDRPEGPERDLIAKLLRGDPE